MSSYPIKLCNSMKKTVIKRRKQVPPSGGITTGRMTKLLLKLSWLLVNCGVLKERRGSRTAQEGGQEGEE